MGLKMPISKIGAALLIVGLVVGVVAGYGVGFVVYQPRISDLESDLSTVESDLAEAQNNITSLQNNITSLQGQINTLSSSLLSTQAELEETQAELMRGRVPILHVGDWWMIEFVFNETTYTWTQNVTGEGPDYYNMYSEYDPPFQGMYNSTDWVDKSTIYTVWSQGQAEYTYDNTTITYTYNMTYIYIYYGGVPLPLIVGKEFNMTEITTYTMTMDNTTYTYEYNMSYVFKVEAIENVTVTAGTFTCFKTNMWNATSGDLLYTMWYSDEAKTWVKYVDYTIAPEISAELKDYSV